MAKQESVAPKIGAGHAAAMARQGLSELRSALYPESNVAQPAQYGLYGTRTPQEIVQDKLDASRDQDELPSSLIDDRLKQTESERDNQSRDARDLERE